LIAEVSEITEVSESAEVSEAARLSEAAEVSEATGQASKGRFSFSVELDNFSGPFDVLLSFIAKHELKITQIALSKVTDDFIKYVSNLKKQENIKNMGMTQISEFLLIASTLLSIKTSSLLPKDSESNTLEDLELLRERDLLFSRILQYKAFKDAAGKFADLMKNSAPRFPHPQNSEGFKVKRDFTIGADKRKLAELALEVLTKKEIGVTHLHITQVDVNKQRKFVKNVLMAKKRMSFAGLVQDAKTPQVIVVRFLVLLELYKADSILFRQNMPTDELIIVWSR
jgi:segregation and condensation protein A